MCEIDHEYTDEITCPYCGLTEGDSWEYRDECGTTYCGWCGEEFYYERHITITYSTSKVVE